MDYKKMKDTFYIRVDKGEILSEVIIDICKSENIQAGCFQGIGACDLITISTYISEDNDFIDHTISGMIEMISLMRNISIDDLGEPVLHSHATFSYLNQKGDIAVVAGHLKNARISYTGEIILNVADEKIGRMNDHKTGIDIWKLS